MTYNKVNDGRKSAIIELAQVDIFQAILFLKPHIYLYSNVLAIWHGLPDIWQNF